MAAQQGIRVANVYDRRLETVNYDARQLDHIMDFTPFPLGGTRASPDGKYVAGLTYGDKIVIINARGVVVRQLPGIWAGCLALSLNAEKVVLQGEAGLFYSAKDSGKLEKLSSNIAPRTPEERECSLGWSPEADRIVYANAGKILIYDLRISKAAVITDGTYPTWSPDGNWIAFRRPNGTAAIRSAHKGDEKTVADGEAIIGSLRWSPNSAYLLYRVRSYGLTNLWASLSTLSGEWTSRLRVYRLADGASATIVPALPSHYGESFSWINSN